jgi:AraC family transcriptional regulator
MIFAILDRNRIAMHFYDRKKLLREEYAARINRVLDYIDKHIDKELSLDERARVANFSRFHFHRIFHGMVGETLNHYIRRLRIQKAASLLIHDHKKSITEIAFDCGFSGSASFARTFKETFDMSASEWRQGGYREYRKDRKTKSNTGKTLRKQGEDTELGDGYTSGEHQIQLRRSYMINTNSVTVEVKDLPEMQVAYIRHIGSYHEISQAFEKLMSWAGPRGLMNLPGTRALAVYRDDPKVTQTDKLRSEACITVPETTQAEGEVGLMTLSSGRFALARFELGHDDYAEAWNWFMGKWMPESGFQPDDAPCYEIYNNDPDQHPEKKCIVDLCVPVKPL